MVVLLEGSPISTEDLWSSVSEHQVLGHPADQGPFPPIAQLGQASSSRKSLGGSKRLPFKNDEGHCVLEDLQCCRHFLVPFPRSVPRHNPVSELYGQFLQPHGLVFALTCTFNCGTFLYRQCTGSGKAQSIEFTTGGLQLNCKNISRMINGNGIHLSSISSLIAKDLNVYGNKIPVFNTFANISKNLFSLCHYGIV